MAGDTAITTIPKIAMTTKNLLITASFYLISCGTTCSIVLTFFLTAAPFHLLFPGRYPASLYTNIPLFASHYAGRMAPEKLTVIILPGLTEKEPSVEQAWGEENRLHFVLCAAKEVTSS
jgi:hypothetical protein